MTFFKILLNAILNKSKTAKLDFVNYFFQHILGINKDFQLPVHFTTQISSASKIKIKGGDKLLKSFAVSGGCYFSGYNGIEFGYNILFAPGVKIISSNHDFTIERNPVKEDPVILGDNVWIGTNAVILPKVVIGNNVIIAAGSIVNKNIPDNAIVAGSPAKVIGWLCICGNKLNKLDNSISQCNSCQKKYKIDEKGLINEVSFSN